MRILPKLIKKVYDAGGNMLEYVRSFEQSDTNSSEGILLSYEFQSGSYAREYFKDREAYRAYASELADLLEKLGTGGSIMEVGCGEAIWLSLLPGLVRRPFERMFGFDIAWSRVRYGKAFFSHLNPGKEIDLFTADLFRIPLPDNSIDIVYTSHSIEPNTGREHEALAECYRVARKYLVLLEPAYEFASAEGRARMKSHGYITGLWDAVQADGYLVREHRKWRASFNPLNPTGVIVIEKGATTFSEAAYRCPLTGTGLRPVKGALFSKEGMLAYPILDGIPCLNEEHAIVAVHLEDDHESEIKQWEAKQGR